jgi:phosphatidylethanolamine-binding protein (PEBP) family uncharacterized protein
VTWTEGPKETLSYAVVFKDLAIIATADPMEMRYNQGFHWVLWNVPPTSRMIPASMKAGHKVTEIDGALQWAPFNDYRFMGPCPNMPPAEGMDPPPRNNDTYSFTVYAMPTPTVDIQAVPMGKSFPRVMDEYLKSKAIAAAEYRGTSDARASVITEGTLPPKAINPCPTTGDQPEGCLKP